MRYFKILVDCGHMGIGRSIEITRYICAFNCVEAFIVANRLPRVKRKKEKTGTLLVSEISFMEYCIGKEEELENPYLSNRKGNVVNLG
jgi:hypothetical protein